MDPNGNRNGRLPAGGGKAMRRFVLCQAGVAMVASASDVSADVTEITASGFTFSPNSVTITAGDTVRWLHGSGIHTVTSGTGASDPEVGLLWDDPLSALNPVVEHQFSAAGTVPFFCRPHALMGMTGVITVVDPPACACDCHADPQCDGLTNVLDVVKAVNEAFRNSAPIVDPNPDCPKTDNDADGNGVVNVLDVVRFVNVAFRNELPEDNFADPCL